VKRTYELMDTESGNLVGTYETEDEALPVVRAALMAPGQRGVTDLALSKKTADGSGEPTAEGIALGQRAEGRIIAHVLLDS